MAWSFYNYLEQEYPELATKVMFATGDVMSGNMLMRS